MDPYWKWTAFKEGNAVVGVYFHHLKFQIIHTLSNNNWDALLLNLKLLNLYTSQTKLDLVPISRLMQDGSRFVPQSWGDLEVQKLIRWILIPISF